MSKPGIIYTGSFKDVQFTTNNVLNSQTFKVEIHDYGTLIDDSSDARIIEMEMAGDPLRRITIDNDEDKFTPIRSTHFEIRVHTSTDVSLNTFAAGEDNRWKVIIYLNSTIIFYGFLVLDDLEMDFMPDPNVLLLVASDNLGILKDITLTDSDGDTFTGYNKIASYLSRCLIHTGLELPIKVINNLREVSYAPLVANAGFTAGVNLITLSASKFFLIGKSFTITGTASNNGTYTVLDRISAFGIDFIGVTPALTTEAIVEATFLSTAPHFYDTIYLEAKTFEKEIGESEDCYTVLEKILGEQCRIFQAWGSWWITNIDELDENDVIVANFNSSGVFQSYDSATTYEKEIGSEEMIFFINEDAIVKPARQHKSIKETFVLETPKEFVCNSDFSRGDLLTNNAFVKTFELDDWLQGIDFPGGYDSQTVDAYIQVDYDPNGREIKRFASLFPPPSASPTENFIESCAIEVGEEDKFSFQFDWAFSDNAAGSGAYTRRVGIIRLEGDDNTYWTMDENGEWFESNSVWGVNFHVLQHTIELSDDQENYVSFSVDSDPIPATGKMYIMFLSENQTRHNVNVYVSGLSLEYHAFINNGYLPVKEQYHKISQDSGNKKRENEVYVSDSPRKIFKGTLVKKDGDEYSLTQGFYRAHAIPSPEVPTSNDIRPFGEWQAWGVWNQYRNCTREFDFTAQGLDTNTLIGSNANPAGMLHTYLLTDANESTTGKKFMLLHGDQDCFLGEWAGFISEVYDENFGKENTDEVDSPGESPGDSAGERITDHLFAYVQE